MALYSEDRESVHSRMMDNLEPLANAMTREQFERLDFGIVGINDINATAAAAPFGGMKESGLGREGGLKGIAEYLETKLGGFSG